MVAEAHDVNEARRLVPVHAEPLGKIGNRHVAPAQCCVEGRLQGNGGIR